jgi:6-phosphogluconolactonase
MRNHFNIHVIRALTMTPVLVALSACGGMSGSNVSDLPANSIHGAANTNVSGAGDYSIGGTVTGLSGDGLTLELNGGSELPVEANGAFTFPGSLSSAAAYSVTIKHQPAVRREICAVTNGSGMVGTTNMGNVSVNCAVAVEFAYVVDPNSQIAVYGITPGTGAPIPDGSYAITPSLLYTAMVLAPKGNFLYVLGRQPDLISTFAIDPDQGGLTQANSPVAAGVAPSSMVVSPNGSFLFVDNIGVGNQTVQTFTVDSATGALTPAGILQLPNQSCSAAACPAAANLAVRSDSKYLYILDYDVVNNTTSVTPFAIDPATGGLTAGAAISFTTNDAGTSMAIDPLGRYLYVAKSAGGGPLLYTSATVVSYAIDPMSGALALGSSTVVANGADLMAPDPTGRYLYVAYYGGDDAVSNVLAFSVDPSSGALSQIGAAVPINSSVQAAACDPSGAFLFLGNFSGAPFTAGQNWSDLTTFTIATSGVNAGAVSLTGQGTQFPSGTTGSGELAIVL